MPDSRSERMSPMTSHAYTYSKHALIKLCLLHFGINLNYSFWHVTIVQEILECIVMEAMKYLLPSWHISNANGLYTENSRVINKHYTQRKLCYIKISYQVLRSSLQIFF